MRPPCVLGLLGSRRRTDAGLPGETTNEVARRAKLVAQVVAVGLVALLFILLAWTLLTEEGGNLAAAAARGERPQAPDFTLERLDRNGRTAANGHVSDADLDRARHG